MLTSTPEVNVFVVDTWESFLDLREHAKQYTSEPFAFDLETDNISERKALIHGIGVCWTDAEAFYIPVRDNTKAVLWDRENLSLIYSWIYHEAKRQKLIGHNIIYDALVFENNSGLDISPSIYSDTILMKHALDEQRPFGLKETAVKYLGPWADKAETAMLENIKKNGGSATKENKEMWKCDTDVLGEYCGWDVLLTRRLFDIFETKLKEEGVADLFYKTETMPLYKEVTIDMKRKGFTIDVPYFQQLRTKINVEISALEDSILAETDELTKDFVAQLLNKDHPVSRSGGFPKMLAELCEVALPVGKTGKPTLAQKALQVARSKDSENDWYYAWLSGETELDPVLAVKAQKYAFYAANPDRRHIFNLKSNDHLGWLFFTKLEEEVLNRTEGGKPQCDDDYLDTVKDKYPFVLKLVDYKKLMKLSSTYIEGILEREIESVIYTSYLMFGTTSGRFSSCDPNLQNLPRIKEDDCNLTPLVLHYANAIKKGFVAPEGYKIVNADYSALEPRCFAHVSGDETLRNVFRNGLDLYCQVAMDVFGIPDCSADPKAANYLKKKHPELRQKAKVFVLAVVYGAEAGRISQAMGIDYKDADEIIQAYLDAYPELKKYMNRCDYLATKHGIAKTEFGRIRHLPLAKELYSRWGDKLIHNRRWVKEQGLGDIRYKLKNMMNLSKNHPIQGLAAHIVNRSMVQFVRQIKKENLDAWICAQTHDELTVIARENCAERVAEILKDVMENTVHISVPLITEPLIGNNWAESK